MPGESVRRVPVQNVNLKLFLKSDRFVRSVTRTRYGSPRMHLELVDRGFEICEATVAKLMQKEELVASTHRRFRIRTTDSNHGLPVAENTVNREFLRSGPNEVWVSDLTYIPTKAGWLYLVVIIDLHSRKVVGWSMNTENDNGRVSLGS